MAKSVGIYGDWSGKIGNIIGYRIHNSNNDITQGIRAYNPNVYNPKTLEQARQRIKVTAAVRFYKAFREFLSISYQGKKNGHACYCEQQRLALTASLSDIPMLPRGADYFVPARYIVATGTLAPRSVVEVSPSGLSSSFVTNLVLPAPLEASQSFGAFSSSLIQSNDGLADGDTVHFIAAYETSLGRFAPWYASFQLDTTSTTPLSSLGVLFASLLADAADGGLYRLAVNLRAAAARSSRCGGAAVAVSRGDGSTQSATLWSTATMAVASFVVQSYFYDAAFASAILTYLPAPVPASPLTLNQGGTTPPVLGKNPYVTDGLVFMLDGIWNNALFDHQENPETWRNLVGSVNVDILNGKPIYGSTYVELKGAVKVSFLLGGFYQFLNENRFTIEVVFSTSSLNNAYRANVINYDTTPSALAFFKSPSSSTYAGRLKGTSAKGFQLQWRVTNNNIVKIYDRANILNIIGLRTFNGDSSVIQQDAPVVLNGTNNNLNSSILYYAIRIYSRNLTDAELAHNNAIDTERFGWQPLSSNIASMAYDGSPLPLHPAVLDTEMPTTDPQPYDETI